MKTMKRFRRQHRDIDINLVLGMTDTPGLWDDDDVFLNRCGKKAAGRMLDGREWNEFPGGSK